MYLERRRAVWYKLSVTEIMETLWYYHRKRSCMESSSVKWEEQYDYYLVPLA